MESDPHELERALAALKPRKLSGDLLDRLEGAMREARQSGSAEKVVPFPAAAARGKRRPIWGAAAAVALFGGGAAFWLVPQPATVGETAEMPVREASPIVSPEGGELVAASFGRGVREATDEGLVWSEDHVPHRRLRIDYVDKVLVKTPDGKTVMVERPRVEWLLVPETMD